MRRRDLVWPLVCGEAGAVNAVVDPLINNLVDRFDLLAQISRIEVVAFAAKSLNSLFNMRRRSSSELLTIRFVFLSQSTGTVTRPSKPGSVACMPR